uniref:CARD domain-containing protein n=1 Tax=Sinocyclocheilus anshuiensis TaxID=1608454 RepID=A0A671KT19_9TELE
MIFFLFVFPDCQMFLKKKFSLLVQNVKNIDPIIDDLVDLHAESVANVRAKSTDQEKMRKLLEQLLKVVLFTHQISSML